MKLNAAGLAAVTAIVRESSDLSVDEATTAATALLMAYFEARERSADPVSPGAPAAARRAPTPKIYLASRSRHGARWRALRESGVPIISTWIDEAEPGQTADYSDLMRRCIEEASRATAFICYAEGDDIAGWKGVWFEMGAACAAGVPVFFVGTHDFPSALRHPNVTFCADLDGALRAALAAPESP